MILNINPSSPDSYALFLRAKSLPVYEVRGRTVYVPDEYADRLGLDTAESRTVDYSPLPGLFDYQRDIAALAIRKRKFAVFAEPGLGKTLIQLEFARHAQQTLGFRRRVLLTAPLMVVRQTIAEAKRFYGGAITLEQVRAADLAHWTTTVGDSIGITNYEAITEAVPQGRLGALVCDESSIMKSHYGKWGSELIRLGKGLEWKLALTGTPAPNDRIEYANHAVFLDAFPTVNSFLAKFFVNRGQTDNRWELKPHALEPFYRALSHWCIFLTNPATYGWKDNAESIPPIHVHIHDVDLTEAQQAVACETTGMLFANEIGGITSRSVISQIAKGNHRGEAIDTNKPEFIRSLVESWPDESTIIWCHYNTEQETMAATFPDAANIDGSTPFEEREILLDWFQGKICTCERERRRKCTSQRTTKPTNTNTNGGLPNNKPPTTLNVEPNTPQTKNCGSKRESKQEHGSKRTRKRGLPKTSEFTDSLPLTTSESLPNREGVAPSVEGEDQPIAVWSGCTSIIATPPESSGGSCVQTATSRSANSTTTLNESSEPQCTCGGIPKARILISKPRLLGFGLNLQIATRQVFSGLQDSYEEFWQAVKRSNRVGSTRPLNVHIPVTDLERPMIETVLRKAERVQHDTIEQERIFRNASL